MDDRGTAAKHGRDDADDWCNESLCNRHPDDGPATDDWQAALDSATEPDEALINAVGTDEVARLFGVRGRGASWSDACQRYNAAWRKRVADRIAEAKEPKRVGRRRPPRSIAFSNDEWTAITEAAQRDAEPGAGGREASPAAWVRRVALRAASRRVE